MTENRYTKIYSKSVGIELIYSVVIFFAVGSSSISSFESEFFVSVLIFNPV